MTQTLQTAASLLGLRVSDSVCSFKSGVLVSKQPFASLGHKSCWISNQMLWGLLFPIQVRQSGDPNVGVRHLAPQGGPPWLYSFHLDGCLPGVVGLDWPHLCPSYLSQYGFFFISYCCRKSVLLVFRPFSEIAVLYVVVILMCLWKEVSSWSTYPTRLTPFFVLLFTFVLNSGHNWSFEDTAFFVHLV